MLADVSAVLDERSIPGPVAAGSAAAQLESAMYDLALAIIRWVDEAGHSRDAERLRTSLAEVEERLLWVQRNRFDADGARTRDELRAAHTRMLGILADLEHLGVALDRIDAESGPEPHGDEPTAGAR